MITIVYNRMTVMRKMMISLLFIIGSIALAYAAVVKIPDAMWKLGSAALSVMGLVYFGRLFSVTLRATVRKQSQLFVYDESGIYKENGDLVPWSNIEHFTVVYTRIGILFQPIFTHYVFKLKNGDQVVWHTYDLLTDEEAKQWARVLQEEVAARGSMNKRIGNKISV
ncbi:hypothetical protein NQ117_08450 [Paenibacillus sp. SC116]|uniref:hypothetical protein n=1 Tax=Paenibacillus sp. SC116 TaxID=2968986 RepID=UPI00215ACC3D|nr:hypothetical protein [Paenibacillus sp. SC116]MCR8843715.1 hypothetical protein [Paenibacillus sp. SC116]